MPFTRKAEARNDNKIHDRTAHHDRYHRIEVHNSWEEQPTLNYRFRLIQFIDPYGGASFARSNRAEIIPVWQMARDDRDSMLAGAQLVKFLRPQKRADRIAKLESYLGRFTEQE